MVVSLSAHGDAHAGRKARWALALYLAFDVGGTKTACLLADEEQVLARATGDSIKTLRVRPAEARLHLEALLLELVSLTGADLRLVRRTCIGTSGASAPAVRDWLRQAVAETIGGELVLLGDEVIALDAAFPARRGILVIAGTGSNIVGRAETGQMVHTGGWGPMLADEGSGHWIGHQALRACFHVIDQAPASSADSVDGGATAFSPGAATTSGGETHKAGSLPAERRLQDLPPLLLRFLDYLKLPDVDALIGMANALEFRFAQLVPTVVAAARDGDPLASEIIHNAGKALALLVSRTVAKLEGLEAGLVNRPGTPGVAYIGGVLANIEAVRLAMHRSLDRRYPGIAIQPEPADALAGALWHARGGR